MVRTLFSLLRARVQSLVEGTKIPLAACMAKLKIITIAVALSSQPTNVPDPSPLTSFWPNCALVHSSALLPPHPSLGVQVVASLSDIPLESFYACQQGRSLASSSTAEWAAFRRPGRWATSACPRLSCGLALIGLAAAPVVK